MLPLAETMATAGVVSQELAAILSVDCTSKIFCIFSVAAKQAQRETSDEVFLVLKKEDKNKA